VITPHINVDPIYDKQIVAVENAEFGHDHHYHIEEENTAHVAVDHVGVIGHEYPHV